MSALAVIFMSVLTEPAPPGREVPVVVGIPHILSTQFGEVEIAPVKVFSTGAMVEVRAELIATPTDLLARPEQVLAPTPEHRDYGLTLRTRSAGLDDTRPQSADTSGEHHPHQWNVSFWVPRAAWADSAPRLVWPVAHLDMPLELNDVEMEKATLVVRTRDQ
ncbi:MAG TPA: hypothetical protein VL595_26600 [Pseudonocardia sp.]|jgi:hypothetical protein|nr:hypothetical protein [Pseudonocardia sp.]